MLRRWLFFIAIITLIFLIYKSFNLKSTIASKNIFNIDNSSQITKIFLADRLGNTITLVKNDFNWIVNDKYHVREDAINTILETAEKIRIMKPVSNASLKKVVEFISTSGIYVEFFIDKKMIKSYWIGSNTSDHLGTYMLLKNTINPFVVHIPSFNGFLTPRYGVQGNILNEFTWRSNKVFNLSADKIDFIKYTNFLDKSNSYSISTDPIKLYSKNKEISFNQNVLKLLNSFKNINCETFRRYSSDINLSSPIEELIVNSDTLRTYKMHEKYALKNDDKFSVKRKYATLNNSELMIIQEYVFNKVLININQLTN